MAEKKWSELVKQYHTWKMVDKTQDKGKINAEIAETHKRIKQYC